MAGKRADSMAGAHRPRGFYREAGCGRVAVLTARELCAIIAVRAAVGVLGARTAGAMCGMGAMRSLQVYCAVFGLQVHCAVWVRCARCRCIARCRCDARYGCDVLGAGALRGARAADCDARFDRGAICSRSALLRYWLRESPLIHRYCHLSPCPKTRSALPFPLYRINHNSRRLFSASYTPALRCLPPTQKHRFTRSGETVL